MSRLLYGSSNVYRHYSRATPGLGLGLSLVECTRRTVFDAHLATLGQLESGSFLVTSVLENFIVDACVGLTSEEVLLFGNQQITAHVEALASLLRNRVNVAAAIVPPIFRLIPGEFKCFGKKRKLRSL